ncbi:MAG: hypothetical protein ACI8TQ_001107 [Planctomycetota bacterium]|jgi:hypothetical protein
MVPSSLFLAAALLLDANDPSPLDSVLGTGAFGFAEFMVDVNLFGDCGLTFLDLNGVTVSETVGPNPMLSGAVFLPELTGMGEQYPLVGLVHGYSVTGDEYLDLAVQLASWGFVVAVVDFEQLHPNDQSSFQIAMDALNVLEYVATTEPYASLIDPSLPWSAVGHSLGGIGTMVMTACDERVRTIVPLVPGTDAMIDPGLLGDASFLSGPAEKALEFFDGAMYLVWADTDEIVIPPAQATETYVQVMSAQSACNSTNSVCRNLNFSVTGALHNAPLDFAEPITLARFPGRI